MKLSYISNNGVGIADSLRDPGIDGDDATGPIRSGERPMRRTVTAIIALAGAAALLAGCDSGGAGTRDSIRAVGSSTVYPFAKAVAEDFTRSRPEFKSPIIESTGTGGGINLFCSGIGASTPDIANASRRMKAAEFAKCQANG